MNLAELRREIQAERISQAGRTTLVWGPPRTGKTRWAATIAKAPQIKKVFFFDFENGYETIIYAKDKDGSPYFTDEELTKIQVIRCIDLPDIPRAINTAEAVFRYRQRTIRLDGETGAFKGKEKTHLDTDIVIEPSDWGPETAFVLDTIGQVGISALNQAIIDKPDAKDNRLWYMAATNQLNNFFTTVQASPAYVIACTHVLEKEIVLATDKSGNPTRTRQELFPLCLSRNYSMNVGRSFGSIIYRYIELNKFAHLSSPIKKSGIQAGTRTGIDVSTDVDMTLPQVLKLIQAEVEAEAKPKLMRKS